MSQSKILIWGRPYGDSVLFICRSSVSQYVLYAPNIRQLPQVVLTCIFTHISFETSPSYTCIMKDCLILRLHSPAFIELCRKRCNKSEGVEPGNETNER